MKKIIVTGFEPFGGSARNASWEAVRQLSGVETVLLPVSFDRACRRIREIAAGDAGAILCVGEAAGRDRISVERVAVNWMDARIPDNDGFQPVDVPVCPGRPAAWFSTLPVRRLREAVGNGEISYSAGTYVCNAVFYTLMDEIQENGNGTLGGFIHVPANGMPPERILEALTNAVQCIREMVYESEDECQAEAGSGGAEKERGVLPGKPEAGGKTCPAET